MIEFSAIRQNVRIALYQFKLTVSYNTLWTQIFEIFWQL